MRLFVFLTFLLLTALAIAPAEAKSIRLVSHPSAAEVKTACDNAGGTFVDDSQLGGGDGYACTNENCDGEGGDCSVSCDGDGNCHGITPDRHVAHALPLVETHTPNDPPAPKPDRHPPDSPTVTKATPAGTPLKHATK